MPSIREMARVLQPGGICLATAAPVFAMNGYAVVNRLAVALPVRRLTRLKQFFTTSRRLQREFEAAGFSDVTVHGVYIGPLIWIERLARPALPRYLGVGAARRPLADRPAPARSCQHVPSSGGTREASNRVARQSPLDRGVFTLSLDFELIWGTLDRGPDRFREACERERASCSSACSLSASSRCQPRGVCSDTSFSTLASKTNGRKHPEIARPSQLCVG